jgi:hypothetical protein
MKSKMILYGCLSLLGGVIGGGLSQSLTSKAHAEWGQVVTAREFRLVDGNGRLVGQWTLSMEGTPALWLFDANGKARLNMALYGDGNPCLVLNDGDGATAKGVFRLAGEGKAPVLVLKNSGRDRIILGMDLPSGDNPGMVYFEKNGNRKDVFGNFKY